MRSLAILLACMFLVACGDENVTEITNEPCTVEQLADGTAITCGDETTIVSDGQDGADGSDGQDGADGEDAVILHSEIVPAGQCVEVMPGIYVENVQSGRLFDVYLNDSCSDSLGEYCDNVIPAYGRSGRLSEDKHRGSGTVCWADDLMITGVKDSKDSPDITVKILEFN